MAPPRTREPGTKEGVAGWRVAAALAATVVCVALWPGCTVTRSNYKTLTMFFDGVPDPDAVAAGAGAAPTAGGGASAGLLSIHPPYAREACSECHDSGLSMTKSNSAVCSKCHEGKGREHAYMHGPVAAGACLWCHEPHESARTHLLRDADRNLCGTCHTRGLLDTARVPAHADEARGCLECHTGHGGAARYMLRGAAAGEKGAGRP